MHLAELWDLKLSPQQMQEMDTGISFDHLLKKGMNAQLMHAFAFPLSGWATIGFNHSHAEKMSENEAQLVFGVNKAELVNILHNFQGGAHVASNMQD